ncbi:MAG: hypothetical protein AB8G23_07510 [Myxococcota bacterium]
MSGCSRNLGLRALMSGFVAWAVLQSPRVASACAVCTAGRDEENQAAFLWSTLFMSLLPLIAIGTLVFVIRRRYKALEAETAAREADHAAQVAASEAGAGPSPSAAL